MIANDEEKIGRVKDITAKKIGVRQEKRTRFLNTKSVIALPEGFKLLQGDFTKLSTDEIPNNSIDLIYTDPRYDAEHLFLYEELAILAWRVLRDGGSLVTNAVNDKIDEILKMICSTGLKYWWTI